MKCLFALIAIVITSVAAAAQGTLPVVSVPDIATMKSLGSSSAFYKTVSVLDYGHGVGGGGIFKWVSGSTATVNLCTVFAASGVSTGRWIRGSSGNSLSVVDCGAVGDGSTDDSASEQSALDVVSTGGQVLWPPSPSCYKTLSVLTVTKSVKIVGPGGLCFSTSNQNGFFVSSSNVSFDGISLTGPQCATFSGHTGENGIFAAGVFHTNAAPTYITNFSVRNSSLTCFGAAGIQTQFIDGVIISDNEISNFPYAGVVALSDIHLIVHHNTLSNFSGTGNFQNEAYPVLISRDTDDVGELTSNPRTQFYTVDNNVIENVPTWEGLDTHSGSHGLFSNNIISNSFHCISIGASVDSGGVTYTYAPIDNNVVGNVCDSSVSDGSRGTGIPFTGAVSEKATGTIVGNTVRGYGTESNTTPDGAILVRSTSGVAVTGNSILYPSPNGVVSAGDNSSLSISGNAIVDPWSNTVAVGQAIGVVTTGNNSSILVGNNTIQHLDKSATYLLTTSTGIAVKLGTGTSNTATLGFNSTNATAYDADADSILASGLKNYGLYSGTGLPTFAAQQGAIYFRVDGSSSSTRLYMNTDGSTGWTYVPTNS